MAASCWGLRVTLKKRVRVGELGLNVFFLNFSSFFLFWFAGLEYDLSFLFFI